LAASQIQESERVTRGHRTRTEMCGDPQLILWRAVIDQSTI